MAGPGLPAASHLAGLSGDHGPAQSLLEQGADLAGELNDPVTSAFAAWITGNVCLYGGDLPSASVHYADGLAALPASAACAGQRVHLLIGTAISAGLAGDEDRAEAAHRQIIALVEAGSEFFRRKYSAYSLWALGLAVWRRGDLDRAARLQQESLRLREIAYDPVGTALNVEALAWIAASGGEPPRAAVLLGAAAALWRSAGVTPADFRPLAEQQRGCEREARQALGEQAFLAAYGRGLELPAEHAVTDALQRPQQPRQPHQPPKKPSAGPMEESRAPAMPGDGPLTPRELQVARLVAGGRSNKQIAAELVISQRTAEGHVERILAKLGFTSRAQVAAWVTASQRDSASRSD